MSFPNAQPGTQQQRVTGSAGGQAWLWMRSVALGAMVLVAAMASGCARRAYNDVYVENMAAEIRDLEDQLYEFDGEYRMLEQQFDALRAENARLKSSLPSSSTAPNNRSLRQQASPSDSNSTDSLAPRAGSSPQPYVPPTSPSKTTPPAKSTTPNNSTPNNNTPNSTIPSPAPSLDIGPSSPSNSAAQPKPLNPGTPSSNNLPSLTPPSLTPDTLPAPKAVPGADKPELFNPNDLSPPTIENGEPMPPTMPPLKTLPSSPVTMQGDNDLELELGQIKLPAQLASMEKSEPDDMAVRTAQIHPAAEMPADTRIVEVKFHPSLCRAVNKDQQGDDDGLYLVLQPYNAKGEFVPLPADLMVLAIDLSRDEKHATIGRWTLSAADVKAKMNPIGSSQGIHLSLSFSGPAPQCDRVLVFAYYTLADGRRVVAEQEVMLNNLHRQNAVWVPRSKGEVRTVSHEARAK